MEPELEALKEKIQRERGFNAPGYKDKSLRRRLAVRMRARGEETFGGYAGLLDRDPAEYELLLDALTINVTRFFRDFETWRAISREVVPHLFDLPGLTGIWSAGCATGEEPYSVSILLREWAEANGRREELDRFRIVATDIDSRSLDAARRAEFPELSLTETPDTVRESWFSREPPFRLRAEARCGTSFVCQDLISGAPERGQSLILCRNVLIYFNRAVQEAIFRRFYDSLVPGGFLVLGRAETLLGATRALFRPVAARDRIFRRPL